MNVIGATVETAEVHGKGTFVLTLVEKDGTPWTLCMETCRHRTPQKAEKCEAAERTLGIWSQSRRD